MLKKTISIIGRQEKPSLKDLSRLRKNLLFSGGVRTITFSQHYLFKAIATGFQIKLISKLLGGAKDGFKLVFDLAYQEKTYSNIELALIGKHNIENGAAVFGLALELGIAETAIREAFKTFKGIKRRLEKRGGKEPFSL